MGNFLTIEFPRDLSAEDRDYVVYHLFCQIINTIGSFCGPPTWTEDQPPPRSSVSDQSFWLRQPCGFSKYWTFNLSQYEAAMVGLLQLCRRSSSNKFSVYSLSRGSVSLEPWLKQKVVLISVNVSKGSSIHLGSLHKSGNWELSISWKLWSCFENLRRKCKSLLP